MKKKKNKIGCELSIDLKKSIILSMDLTYSNPIPRIVYHVLVIYNYKILCHTLVTQNKRLQELSSLAPLEGLFQSDAPFLLLSRLNRKRANGNTGNEEKELTWM